MRFVLDHCVPRPLLHHLTDFEIVPAGQMGWAELVNGMLLDAADAQGFAALITVDKGFATQQYMEGRGIAVVLLDAESTKLESLLPLVPRLAEALREVKAGTLTRIANSP